MESIPDRPRTVSLLCYADRVAGSLAGLGRLLHDALPEFTGVHVLPFYDPHDGADAGFDPIDHRRVSPALGDWDDVRALAESRQVTADLIVNHTSSEAPEFLDWLARGSASPHDGMFLTFDAVFPGGASEADIVGFYRPRPGLPFTPYRGADGSRHLVWTTFQPTQVDLDLTHPAGRGYVRGIMDALRDAGVEVVRLDAVGYAVKTAGTPSFMTLQTLDLLAELVRDCHERGLTVLVEVHSHHRDQVRLAGLVDLVYDFALPPTLLHAAYTGDTAPLASWLRVRPENSVAVLDTHDGIGVVDALGAAGADGLLTDAQAAALFEVADELTGGVSGRASVVPQFNPMPHQINATFLGVLGSDLESLLALRVVQLLLPGPAHVYYMGALGLGDDERRWLATGEGRDVNRHSLAAGELAELLATPYVAATRALVAFVPDHPALAGDFSWQAAPGRLRLTWTDGVHLCCAEVTLGERRARFTLEDRGPTRTRLASSIAGLAAWLTG